MAIRTYGEYLALVEYLSHESGTRLDTYHNRTVEPSDMENTVAVMVPRIKQENPSES